MQRKAPLLSATNRRAQLSHRNLSKSRRRATRLAKAFGRR